jgi:hypothetical protein
VTFKRGETPKGATPFPKGVSGNPAGRPPGIPNLEARVQALLNGEASRMKPDMRDRLDGPGGPLETFSQRITMGRVLGIYGEDTEYNLNVIRQIRNTFAHAHTPITFATKEVAAAKTLFRDVPILPPYAMDSDKAQAPIEPRAKFNFFCTRTTHNLIIASAHAKRRVPI